MTMSRMNKIWRLGAALGLMAVMASANAGLSISTGPKGKGYSKQFADIAAVCGREVGVSEVVTTGGLDNLNAMSTNESDLGFASVDTVLSMKGGDENIAGLQVLMPLNYNYLHVITNVNGYVVKVPRMVMGVKMGTEDKVVAVRRFTDLRGKTVALVGSAQLLGRKLNSQLGYGMQVVDAKDDAEAFAMVKSGRVSAAMSVAGWPSGPVNSLKDSDGLTLVPFDAPINEPYKVRSLNYKGIGVYNSPTLGVRNVLLTRPFRGAKANDVVALRKCIADKLIDLQEGSFSPSWKEVKSFDENVGLPVFKK